MTFVYSYLWCVYVMTSSFIVTSAISGPDDITGVTQSITVTPGTLSSVEFVLVADDISPEDAEVFELRLEPTTQIGGTVFLVDDLRVAIIDGDGECAVGPPNTNS